MQLRKLRAPGGNMPAGYGVAYFDPQRRGDVCYPIPLNFLVGWSRSAHSRLTDGPADANLSNRQRTYNEGYRAGYLCGEANAALRTPCAAAGGEAD